MREYIPTYRSGPYALMLTLYQESQVVYYLVNYMVPLYFSYCSELFTSYTYFLKKNSLCSKDAAPIAFLIVLFLFWLHFYCLHTNFLRSFYWLRKPSGSLGFPRIPGKRELTPCKPGKPGENISGFPEFAIILPCQKSSNGICLLRHLRFLSEFAIFM